MSTRKVVCGRCVAVFDDAASALEALSGNKADLGSGQFGKLVLAPYGTDGEFRCLSTTM